MNGKHIGSSFDDFLAEDATLQDATAVAVKRVIAWKIVGEMPGAFNDVWSTTDFPNVHQK